MSQFATHMPNAWANETALDGVDIVAKQELVGVPMLITAVWFETNERGVQYVYVEAEDGNATAFTFNDSSSGVRAQIIEHLDRLGKADVVETGEVYPLRLVIPRGLRVSEFEVKDERNRIKLAKTFYLTTSGTRRGEPAAAPAKKTTRPARPAQKPDAQ